MEENPTDAKKFFGKASNIDNVVLKWAGWDGTEDTLPKVIEAFKLKYKDKKFKTIPSLRSKDSPLVVAWKKFKADVLDPADPRGQALKSLDWKYGKDPLVVKWYENLSDEAKKIAILNTRGYLESKKWLIPDAKARALGKGEIATLPIGAKHVQGMLDKIQDEVMQEVFAIFDEMATMSEKLNSYFANGLKAPEEARKGAEKGEAAAEKARKVAADT